MMRKKNFSRAAIKILWPKVPSYVENSGLEPSSDGPWAGQWQFYIGNIRYWWLACGLGSGNIWKYLEISDIGCLPGFLGFGRDLSQVVRQYSIPSALDNVRKPPHGSVQKF